jgi:hypothetical protein
MTELTRWEPSSGRDVVDGWVGVLVQVEELSRVIAGTEFVPTAFRGRPAAVGAAILAGREIGIGPMTALTHLHVIEGRPSMSAQLMRALVQAAGHRIRVVESSSTRCILAGQRRDEDEGTTVTFTIDDARLAGLDRRPNWVKYPRAMLVARATGELCRLIFADVLGGISLTVEEAGEIVDDWQEPSDPVPPRQTVKRATRVRKAPEPEPAPEPAPEPEPVVEDPVVEAEIEAELVEPQPEPEPDPVAPEPAPVEEPPRSSRANEPLTREQTGKIFALLTELGAGEPRERRIEVASALLARRVASFATLTVEEASVLIDTLTRVTESERPADWLSWVVKSGLDHLERIETGTDAEPAPVVEGPWGTDEPPADRHDPEPDEYPSDE